MYISVREESIFIIILSSLLSVELDSNKCQKLERKQKQPLLCWFMSFRYLQHFLKNELKKCIALHSNKNNDWCLLCIPLINSIGIVIYVMQLSLYKVPLFTLHFIDWINSRKCILHSWGDVVKQQIRNFAEFFQNRLQHFLNSFRKRIQSLLWEFASHKKLLKTKT